MSPRKLEFIGSAVGLNNSHIYQIAAPNQPLNDILRHDTLRILLGYRKVRAHF